VSEQVYDRSHEIKPLGQILLAQGSITEPQIAQALSLQTNRTERLGELLCELGHLDPQTFKQVIEDQNAEE